MSCSFSLIICAYNPDTAVFKRLLAALEAIALQKTYPPFEIILVDNNSTPALESQPDVKRFIESHLQARIITETKPGLTSARIAGAKEAGNEWIIFFDDDNEPAADYLLKANSLIEQYPQAGVWGPGKITVEFMGEVSSFAHSHKDLFQERNMGETIIDNVRWGQTAYPYGTGMIVRKNIMDEYVRFVEIGAYTMSDRIGKSLISGGDMQILLTGIKMGFYAGSSPDLALTHLIKVEKTQFKKILQLVFMLSASAVKLYNEVFPDAPHTVVPISNGYVLSNFYTQFRLHFFKKPAQEAVYLLAKRIGELYAHNIAAKSRPPVALRLFNKLLHI